MKRSRKITLILVAVITALGVWWQSMLILDVVRGDGNIDLERLIAHAQRCNDAYHDHDIFRHEYGDHVKVGEFPASGLRVYFDAHPDHEEQWVILRGTANLPNVLEDLEFLGGEEHELGIQVHAGFNRTFQECLPWIIEHLDRDRPVRVTGHSLGGAVAVLLVATLEHRGFEDVSGVTFGQPKITDAHGAKKLATLDLIRVVHDSDPVPMMPPVFVEVGELGLYHHAGPEIVVRPNGKFVHLLRHLENRFDVVQHWRDLHKIDTDSHDMTKGYLPALRKALKMSSADD